MSYSSLAYAKGQCRPDELNYKGRVYRAEVAAGSEGDSSQVAYTSSLCCLAEHCPNGGH